VKIILFFPFFLLNIIIYKTFKYRCKIYGERQQPEARCLFKVGGAALLKFPENAAIYSVYCMIEFDSINELLGE
jgi:hypothetical protein